MPLAWLLKPLKVFVDPSEMTLAVRGVSLEPSDRTFVPSEGLLEPSEE